MPPSSFRKLFSLGQSPSMQSKSLFAPDLGRQLQAMQQNTDDATRAARKNDQNDVRTVAVTLPIGPVAVSVAHGLNRIPKGYMVASVTSGTEAPNFAETGRDEQRIELMSNQVASAVGIKLRVF